MQFGNELMFHIISISLFQAGTSKSGVNTNQSPASRYLAALTPVKKDTSGTVSLGSGLVPSVRQTQRLLLMKTGGLLTGTDGHLKYPEYV